MPIRFYLLHPSFFTRSVKIQIQILQKISNAVPPHYKWNIIRHFAIILIDSIIVYCLNLKTA